MKTTGITMKAESGGESDAMGVFISTVEYERRWLLNRITAMGGNGGLKIMVEIGGDSLEELRKMYKELVNSGDSTIGDGLHWRDGEVIMSYFREAE